MGNKIKKVIESVKNNKILTFLLISISISIIVGIPYALNSWVINNDWYSKAGNDGWVSFWGSYLGGMFGGVGTLIAVYITVRQTRKIESENRRQVYINNINEEIRDYKKMFKAVKKNSNDLEGYILEDSKDVTKFPQNLKALYDLMNDYILIASMYLSEEIAFDTADIYNSYSDMILFGKSILQCIKNNEKYEDDMEILNEMIKDIIKQFDELSKKLHSHIRHSYAEKYEKLHVKKEL